MASDFISVTAVEGTQPPSKSEPLGVALVNTDEIVMVICFEEGSAIVLKDYATKIIVKETAADIYKQINKIQQKEKIRRPNNAVQTEDSHR